MQIKIKYRPACDDVEIVHGEMGQFDYPSLVRWIQQLDQCWKPDVFLIEKTGAGCALPFYLREKVIYHVETTASNISKLERMEMVSPRIEAGRVWLPDAAERATRFRQIIDQFPYGSTADWPDALSQLLMYHEKIRHAAAKHRLHRFPPPHPPQPATTLRHGMHYQRFDYV